MITVRTEKETFTVKLPEKESQEAFGKIVDILRNPARGEENIENAESFCEQKAEILPEEKHSGTPKMDVFKKIQDDPDNPFGAFIKANGQSLSLIHILKRIGVDVEAWHKESEHGT